MSKTFVGGFPDAGAMIGSGSFEAGPAVIAADGGALWKSSKSSACDTE